MKKYFATFLCLTVFLLGIAGYTAASVHLGARPVLTTEESLSEEASPVEELKVEEPQVEEPQVEEPQVEEPQVEEPQVEEPQVEEPQVEEPQVEEPQVEEPQVEEPQVEEPQVEEPDYHYVEAGETLFSISQKFGISVEEIKQINGLTSDVIWVGQLLYLVEQNSEVETPVVETPEVETPEVETPEAETPEVETPEVETPEVETPEVETPEVETPVVETPEVETPEVETPEVETPVGPIKHVVQAGESLSVIAEMYDVSASDIAKYNGITVDSILYIGDILLIPLPGEEIEKTHIVKAGETLLGIAECHNITLELLVAYNGIKVDDPIYVGQILKIPPPGVVLENLPTTDVSSTELTYTIVPGDTLGKIANNFGVTVEALVAYNNIVDPNNIVAGTTLKIPPKDYVPEGGYVNSNVSEVVYSGFLRHWTLTSSSPSWHNIKVSAAQINGLTIQRGQTFSWNNFTQGSTPEEGFIPAPILYVNADGSTSTVNGYGGGVCFVSTSLHYGAKGAGCRIDERTPHSRRSSYGTQDMEATVSYGGPDFVFTNTTSRDLQFLLEPGWDAEGYLGMYIKVLAL